MKGLLLPFLFAHLLLLNQGIEASENQIDPIAELEKERNITSMNRTRSDIFAIATAVESYAVDHTRYPWVETIEKLGPYLEPIYIRAVPQNDAWGTKFKFIAEESSLTYQIVSAGADRQFDPSSWARKDPYIDLNDDIVFENGSFLRDWKPPEKQVVPGAAAALRASLDQYVQNQPFQDLTLEKRELGLIAIGIDKVRDAGERKELQQYVNFIEGKFPQSARASMVRAFFNMIAGDFKEASAALKRAETLFPAYAQLDMASKIRIAQRKQTIADMRAIGTAVEAFFIDYNAYPLEKEGKIENLRSKVEPNYIRELPLQDAWGNPFFYRCVEPRGPYWIISHGADGMPDAEIYDEHGIPVPSAAMQTSEESADIVFSDGRFTRYPEEK